MTKKSNCVVLIVNGGVAGKFSNVDELRADIKEWHKRYGGDIEIAEDEVPVGMDCDGDYYKFADVDAFVDFLVEHSDSTYDVFCDSFCEMGDDYASIMVSV